MSQLLHAGIIAGRRQLAALAALTLILLVITPLEHIDQYSLTGNKKEILPLSAMPVFTWAALLVALGLALTSSRSIDVTASRIHRASRFIRLGPPAIYLDDTRRSVRSRCNPICSICPAEAAQCHNFGEPLFWFPRDTFDYMDGCDECGCSEFWRGNPCGCQGN
jgi:hypothetical protein